MGHWVASLDAIECKKSIQNPELFHCSQNYLRERGAPQGEAAMHRGSLDTEWREHINFPHFRPKASQEEATPRELSVALRHLHHEEKSTKYSKKASRSSGNIWSWAGGDNYTNDSSQIAYPRF